MQRLSTFVAALFFCAAVAGCSATRPDWRNPGSASQQQQRAVVFDPYADVYGGPEVVGGRPRGYQQPLSEPHAAQVFHDIFWIPPAYAVPPPASF